MTDAQATVAILTQYFHPEVPGTAQISTDLALGLSEAGFDVRVYTGQPAFLESQRLPSLEDYRGVHINRAYSRRLSRKGIGSRLFNIFTVAAFALMRLMRSRRPDVVLVDSTSPSLLVIAWLMRRLRRVPYVFIVHDVYPEIAIQVGIVGPNAMTTQIWRWAYRRVYNGADRIVVLGERMKQIVLKSVRHDRWDRCVVIPNWADGDAIVPRPPDDNPMRAELGLGDKFVVLYSGNMGLTHDIETVVEAADRMQGLEDLRFLLIGGGGRRDEVAEMVRQKDLQNVTMLPYQPQEKLPYSLTCGDISIVTLGTGIEGLSVPSKLYSSLAAGLAVVAIMGPGSEVGDVVDEYECGYRVSQGDVNGLVEAITTLHADHSLLSDMRLRARACFEGNFTKTMSIGSYATLLSEVATGSRSPVGVTEDAA